MMSLSFSGAKKPILAMFAAAASVAGLLLLDGSPVRPNRVRAGLIQAMYCQSGYGTSCPSLPCNDPDGYYCSAAPVPAQCQGPSQDNCNEIAVPANCGVVMVCSTQEEYLDSEGETVFCPADASACKTLPVE